MVVDAGRVAAAPLTPFTGQGFRHLGPRYDPLSGEGARLHGGRFNPPGSFPVLYICQSRPCAVAELKRLGERQAIGVEGLLPRVLYRYEIELDRVLDLTDGEVRARVGLGTDVLTGPDWTACQDLGVAAHALGANGISSHSATGVGTSSPSSSSTSASVAWSRTSSRNGARRTWLMAELHPVDASRPSG